MVKITNVNGVIEKEIAMTLVFLNMQIKTLCLYKIEKAYEKNMLLSLVILKKHMNLFQKLSEMLIMLGCTLMVIRFSI